MGKCQYCTPEWLEESAKQYRAKPSFEEKLKNLTDKICYRVKAEPSWGIDRDILFGSFIEAGKLMRLAFFSEEEAKGQATYIMAATPQTWKKILRNESKFLAEFMLGKIVLEMGNKVSVLSLAPLAPTLVAILTQCELQFPDEMSAEELAKYRAYMEEFRKKLGV